MWWYTPGGSCLNVHVRPGAGPEAALAVARSCLVEAMFTPQVPCICVGDVDARAAGGAPYCLNALKQARFGDLPSTSVHLVQQAMLLDCVAAKVPLWEVGAALALGPSGLRKARRRAELLRAALRRAQVGSVAWRSLLAAAVSVEPPNSQRRAHDVVLSGGLGP